MLHPGQIGAVAKMHVSMSQIGGLVAIQQISKSLEASMRRILSVSRALDRRVGHHKINPPRPTNIGL